MPRIYRIRLMFEWGGGCLWCDNEAAREKFDVGAIEDALSLSQPTREELREMSAWHDGALDWQDPAGPSPWSQEELDRFELAARKLKSKLETELGPEFEIVYVPLGAESI